MSLMTDSKQRHDPIPDVQGASDARRVAIDKVGVKNVTYPIRLLTKDRRSEGCKVLRVTKPRFAARQSANATASSYPLDSTAPRDELAEFAAALGALGNETAAAGAARKIRIVATRGGLIIESDPV